MKKRILSLVIISAMLAVFIPAINAEEKEDNEKVTLIVEVMGEAALETDEAILMGAAKYNETQASIQQTERILSVQERVQKDIKNKVNKKADFGFTYTNVLNGFSVTVNKSDIDKIKALPNVENVYISQTYKRIEPVEPEENTEIQLFSDEDILPVTESTSGVENCCEMMNVQYMHELGYKGQGQVIVVIDSELDVNHEMFAQPIENPKYTKADIARIIRQKKLNVNVEANQVWRSDKVPFAYSYAENTADVFINHWLDIHGTMVSGVAVGKNGTLPNGNKFSSVAPEAQIIFMSEAKRDTHEISHDAILAAVDDASKMDVAAINISSGEDYQYWGDIAYEKAINTAVAAGIMVCLAAGNSGNRRVEPSLADCSAAGYPAGISSATTVASAESDMYWDIVSNADGEWEWIYRSAYQKGMDEYSSYGTNVTLELKPEITATGTNILCPQPGAYAHLDDSTEDEYFPESGTSVAAPHMTGAAALMRQYIEENYQGKYENPAKFIENLTMTGAKILKKYDIPYSPRCQGAGLLDLEAAMTTPVILIGTEDKSKISLKDKLTDTFKIEFTAKNFTDNDVTYDIITPYVTTDNRLYSWGEIRNFYPSSLNFTSSDKPETVTVPANGETKISFTIELDSKQTAENLKIFINGFFIDGFVELSDSSNSVPTISIPYTGFYGDWTAAPAFDKPYYQGGYANTSLTSRRTEVPTIQTLGENKFFENDYRNTDYHAEEYAGISPNGDNELDILRVYVMPQRTMADCAIRIENSNGEIVKQTGNTNAGLDKFIQTYVNFNMDDLPDGDYTVYATGHLAYEGAKNEEISMKFYIDTVAPEIIKKEIRENTDEEGSSKTYLDISMSDNRYVMGAYAEGKNTDGTDFKSSMYTKAGKTGECSIDITGADVSTLKITALDYAYNKTECNVVDEPAPSPSPTVEPTPSPSVIPTLPPKTGDRVEFKRIDNVVSASLIFEETTPPTENDIWLIVAYNDNGELKRVEMPQITDMTAGFVIPQKYRDCEISVYIWDKNMKPLMQTQTLTFTE
ncbi:MAG: S8 family serine peptidase [Oscillospiraceae bacterium]|nr:S8 family serine peptidase [Oscillospiraceae bacterium]